MSTPPMFATFDTMMSWLRDSPPGTLVPAAAVLDAISAAVSIRATLSTSELVLDHREVLDWRERLWTVPEETRIGAAELAQALGKPKSWVYRQTAVKRGALAIPHRKLEGGLVFIVREIRLWLPRHEQTIVGISATASPPFRMQTRPASRHSAHKLL